MNVNFNLSFKDFKGDVIVENGKEKRMSEMVATLLFAGQGITTNEEKLKAFSLSQKIYHATGEINIEVEEAALIKKVAESLNAGGYAQVINLIENK